MRFSASALASVAAILSASLLATAMPAQAGTAKIAKAASVAPSHTTTSSAAQASESQIIHVLNRLAFGPRPGDLERVKAMGIWAYVNQQLEPRSIPDPLERASSISHRTPPSFIPANSRRVPQFPGWSRPISAGLNRQPESSLIGLLLIDLFRATKLL